MRRAAFTCGVVRHVAASAPAHCITCGSKWQRVGSSITPSFTMMSALISPLVTVRSGRVAPCASRSWHDAATFRCYEGPKILIHSDNESCGTTRATGPGGPCREEEAFFRRPLLAGSRIDVAQATETGMASQAARCLDHWRTRKALIVDSLAVPFARNVHVLGRSLRRSRI